MAILELIAMLAALAWWSPVAFIFGIWALCTGQIGVGVICLLSGALPFWVLSLITGRSIAGGSGGGGRGGGGGGGGSIGSWISERVANARVIGRAPESRGHLYSRRHRDLVMAEVDAARPCDLFGFDSPDRDVMGALRERLASAIKLLVESGDEMYSDDKKECHEAIQAVREGHRNWRELHQRQNEEGPSDRRAYLEQEIDKNRRLYVQKAKELADTRRHADEWRNDIAAGRHADWNAGAVNQLLELERQTEDIEAKLRKLESRIEENEKELSLL